MHRHVTVVVVEVHLGRKRVHPHGCYDDHYQREQDGDGELGASAEQVARGESFEDSLVDSFGDSLADSFGDSLLFEDHQEPVGFGQHERSPERQQEAETHWLDFTRDVRRSADEEKRQAEQADEDEEHE